MEPETAKSTSPAPDAELLTRFRGGDRGAFDEIVRAHRRTVYAIARRVLGSHEDADEAAQRTFVRAWKALSRFRGESAIRTWLVRIALNVSRSMRKARREVVGLEEIGMLADGAESAGEAIGRRQAGARVRRAVAGLPPRQQQVVWLKVFSEMTHAEVAAVMQLSEGAVKAHLHQAVANLRRRLGAPEPDGET